MAQDALATLLDIPAFLQVGTPENDAARAAGAAIFASRPRLTTAAKTRRIAPTVTEKKRTKRDRDRLVRDRLVAFGIAPGKVKEMSITKVKKCIADIVAGESFREDLL